MKLYISHAVHASALEVDEEGATAAAATAVMMSRSLPMEIEVRRPFLFFIRNNQNGLILFAGRINRPDFT